MKIFVVSIAFFLSTSAILSTCFAADDRNLQLRLERVERIIQQQQAGSAFQSRLDILQQENQQLRSLLEEQTYKHEKLKRRIHSLYEDMDRRIISIESGNSSQPNQSNVTSLGNGKNVEQALSNDKNKYQAQTATTVKTKEATKQLNKAKQLEAVTNLAADKSNKPSNPMLDEEYKFNEQKAYKKAFNELKSSRYAKAEKSFNQFLKTYPSGKYSQIAQYWLSETNYIQRKFKLAIANYTKILSLKPVSSKYKEAKLKIAYCYFELKDRKNSKQIAKDLITKFPNSTEAKQAKYLLKQLK